MNQQKMTKRTKTALWLLIAPTALWVVVFILYAIVNFAVAADYNTGINNGGDLFSDGTSGASIVALISNVFLFLAGTVAFISWLPGLIIGIILLATKPAQQPPQPPQVPPAA